MNNDPKRRARQKLLEMGFDENDIKTAINEVGGDVDKCREFINQLKSKNSQLIAGMEVWIYSVDDEDWVPGHIVSITKQLISIIFNGHDFRWLEKDSHLYRIQDEKPEPLIRSLAPHPIIDVEKEEPNSQYTQPKPDEMDYHATFPESVLGLELYSDEDGFNCIVGRCVSSVAKQKVQPGSQIIQVNEKWVAGRRFEEIRDSVKQAAKSPPLEVTFRIKKQLMQHSLLKQKSVKKPNQYDNEEIIDNNNNNNNNNAQQQMSLSKDQIQSSLQSNNNNNNNNSNHLNISVPLSNKESTSSMVKSPFRPLPDVSSMHSTQIPKPIPSNSQSATSPEDNNAYKNSYLTPQQGFDDGYGLQSQASSQQQQQQLSIRNNYIGSMSEEKQLQPDVHIMDDDNNDDNFAPFMTLDQLSNLKPGDQIDHRDDVGRYLLATVIAKNDTQVKIHYEGWNSKWDTWSDFVNELHRFSPAKSVSRKPNTRFPNLKTRDYVDINPSQRHPGWRIGQIRRMDKYSGQAQIVYKDEGQEFLYWAHLNNPHEISPFMTKAAQNGLNNPQQQQQLVAQQTQSQNNPFYNQNQQQHNSYNNNNNNNKNLQQQQQKYNSMSQSQQNNYHNVMAQQQPQIPHSLSHSQIALQSSNIYDNNNNNNNNYDASQMHHVKNKPSRTLPASLQGRELPPKPPKKKSQNSIERRSMTQPYLNQNEQQPQRQQYEENDQEDSKPQHISQSSVSYSIGGGSSNQDYFDNNNSNNNKQQMSQKKANVRKKIAAVTR